MRSAHLLRLLGAGAVLLCGLSFAAAAPTVDRTDTGINVTLDNGVTLRFATARGYLLGLQTAMVDGVALKSDQTVVRPYLIQEWTAKPLAWEQMRVADVNVAGNTVKLVCELYATDGNDAARRLFVFQDGHPYADLFKFAHTQLPAEVERLDTLAPVVAPTERVRRPAAGQLTWVIEPITLNIAGWPWRGWKHHYEFQLANGQKVNCLRELGTWETEGQACGNTLVSLRYRGLGGIVAKLEPLADAPGNVLPVRNSFTTTEIMPGAVNQAPVVSPAVPGPQNIASREEGMKYRHGAWIAQLQRGAGSGWVDFQYRPQVALAAWYDKMTAVRSLTEVWPGDTQISQYDGLYFPLTDRQATVDKYHLALVATAKPLPENEWHTRWQEMDKYVRDHVSQELGYVLQDPVPTVGFNFDSGWEFRLKGLIQGVDALKQAGVKRVLMHHSGWFNGRGLRQKETAFPIPTGPDGKPDTGGDCSMHDYIPQSDKVHDLWQQAARTCNANGIDYWVWVTGMLYHNSPIVQQVGPGHFTRNGPGEARSCGYPGKPDGTGQHEGISIRDPQLKAWFEGRMDTAIKDLGVQGFWADSFQNMFMSQMNYQMADQAPQVRDWWEWIAQVSREGVGWMSEPTSFPSLSCSIEVGDNPKDFEGVWWVLPYTTRWYRGEEVPNKGTEKADRLYFRSMANKGPICPGMGFGDLKNLAQVPSMKRFSDEYMAALPQMRRPYQLADERGVLWLTSTADGAGVFFSFIEQPLPQGVQATYILDGAHADKLEAQKTYAVKGADLLTAFGIQRGPEKDPRLGQPYTPPVHYQKQWPTQ